MKDSELFDVLDLSLPDLNAVKTAVDQQDLSGAKRALAAHLRQRNHPRWFFDWKDRPTPTKTGRDFPKAEAFLRREFTFGFDGAPDYTTTFGDKINWGANPTEGEYKTHLWNECLNRHFHFQNLVDAYVETSEERFVDGLVRDWVDWIENNPRPDHSGNRVEWPYGCYAWQTLTTGIRLEASWPNALYWCLGSDAFTDDAIAAILGSVCDQARHLLKWPTAHNWLTEESMGLYTAGMLFPEFKEATGWRQTAIERLYKQLTDEVYPDGAEYELAAGYGNWVVRNFVNLLERARLNGLESELPKDLVSRMEKMFSYVMSVSMPDGKMPGLNDSDNDDVTGLLKTACELFPNREDFLYIASGREKGKPPRFMSVGLPWSGHYAMRSGWDANALFMLFDSGPYGSAHQHEDKLHFVVYACGRQLILDPGNFSYDASRWRRYVLTTPGHNTVMVDGLGQHRRGKRETFFWPRPWEGDAPKENDTAWVNTAHFDFLRGTYRDGYARPKPDAETKRRPEQSDFEEMNAVTHTRRVVFVKSEYWIVVDTLVATDGAEHHYDSLFHFDADEALVNELCVITQNADANVAVVPMSDDRLTVRVVKGLDDPVQGWANSPWRPVPTAVYSLAGKATTYLAYAICPTPAEKKVPVVSVKRMDGGMDGDETLGLDICLMDGRRDVALFSHRAGQHTLGEFETDAEAAVVRLKADGTVNRTFQTGGSFIRRGGKSILED
jgi:hypothetical protein